MKKPLNTPMPTATIRPARRASLFWLIPAVGFIAGAILAYNSIFPEGIPITIQFAHGHGIKINDDIRHRGIRIGRITGVCLTPDGQAVEIKALLVPSAKGMAREGSRFCTGRSPKTNMPGLKTCPAAKPSTRQPATCSTHTTPDILASEIIENIEAGLESFKEIMETINGIGECKGSLARRAEV